METRLNAIEIERIRKPLRLAKRFLLLAVLIEVIPILLFLGRMGNNLFLCVVSGSLFFGALGFWIVYKQLALAESWGDSAFTGFIGREVRTYVTLFFMCAFLLPIFNLPIFIWSYFKASNGIKELDKYEAKTASLNSLRDRFRP